MKKLIRIEKAIITLLITTSIASTGIPGLTSSVAEASRNNKSKNIMAIEPAYKFDLGPVNYYIVSPNGRRFACAVEQNGQWYLILDGKKYGPYDEILRENLRLISKTTMYWSFSSDSKHFAACLRHGGSDYLFIDGEMGPACTELDARKLDYSPSNESFACEAKQNDRWGWLVRKSNQAKFYTKLEGDDDVQRGGGGELFGLDAPSTTGRNQFGVYKDPNDPYFSFRTKNHFCLSGNHQHTYYFKSKLREGIWFVFDGQVVGHYRGIRSFWFTQDGHYGFVCSLLRERGRDPLLNECIVNGKAVAHTTAKETTINSMCLSSEGRRYAYKIRRNKKYYLICDGKEFGPFLRMYNYGFGPGGKHFWIDVSQGASKKEARRCLLYDGQVIPYYPVPKITDIYGSHIVFSPDGTRMAFPSVSPDYVKKRINSPRTYVMVVDGKPSPVYTDVGVPVFSPDSKHIAFWADKSEGKDRPIDKYIVLDGKEISVKQYTELDNKYMLFSPDSRDLWYYSSDHGDWLMRNDQPVCRTDGPRLLRDCNFTEDYGHLIFGVSSSSMYSLSIEDTQIYCPSGSYKMPPGLRKHIALPKSKISTVSMFIFTSDNLHKADIYLTD